MKPTKSVTKDIIQVPIKQLLEKLTKAYADEWMASYQYWVGALIVRGPNRAAVATELNAHAQEELAHAQLLANRIIALGGSIQLYPHEWKSIGGCHYDAIKTDKVLSVLNENIIGEQCAINFYHDLLRSLEGKDLITYSIILKILEDEIEHEQDLQMLLEDIKVLK
jgi:bacterioferritin